MSTRKSLLNSAATFAANNDGGTAETKLSKADRLTLKEVRAAFEEIQGHDLRLTDSAILAIVGKFSDDDWDGMEDEKKLNLFVTAEDAFKGIAVSDPGISGLIAKLDPEFYKEVEQGIEAFIKSKQTTMDTFGGFKRVWTKAQFDACPYPGSDKDDVKGTNYKPDIVETKSTSGEKIRTVFINDLVQAMPIGKAYQADIDDTTKELATAGSVSRLKAYAGSKQKLKDLQNSAKQGRDALRRMVRTAIQLHHKLSAIDGMPLVKWSFIQGSSDKCALVPKDYQGKEFIKVSRSTKPFWFKAADDEASGRDFSAAQVIAFKPSKAMMMEGGGTLGNLIESAKGEPDTAESLGEKMSEETMDTNVVAIAAKLGNTAIRAALRKRVLEPNNGEVKASYMALHDLLVGFAKANRKWYDTYLHGQESAQEKEEREKLQANG